ncbi:MAG: DNA repair protein RadA, partial [Zetaproteobacteria bacterium]
MSKQQTAFVCQDCGSVQRKWLGRCPDCGAWNALVEERLAPKPSRAAKASPQPQPITEIAPSDIQRLSTGIEELDAVLGGGIVPASAILVGGDPGVGKSTLLLQTAANIARQGAKVLYATGEESAAQIQMRAERIGALAEDLHVLAETEAEAIAAAAEAMRPKLVIVDSIQTMRVEELASSPGSVAQVRECAARFCALAKRSDSAVVLVGHVTKEGAIAGPRVVEHLVDAVLYFEGERGYAHRILRAVKNRFGPAGEVGVFEMTDQGLVGVREASQLFLAERAAGEPGSVVYAAIEGTRPLLVELQALVAPTVYATPRRATVGLDANRAAMIAAVLERRLGAPLAGMDLYLNAVGGLRLLEPAADLPAALAMLSAALDVPLPEDTCAFGELGLAGELRPVSRPEARVREAIRMGFRRIVLPRGNL